MPQEIKPAFSAFLEEVLKSVPIDKVSNYYQTNIKVRSQGQNLSLQATLVEGYTASISTKLILNS